jgi:PKD repeat protein
VDVDVVLTVVSCVPVSDADFTWSADPMVGETVTFTGTVKANSSTPIQYTWDFGDGTAPVQSEWEYAHTYVVQHTYTTSDTYHVVMTATNCAGASTSVDSEDVVVMGEPDISVNPLSLSAVLNPNTSAGQTSPRELIISNADGTTADLIWNLVETPMVSWLGEAPTSGAISPSESSDVKVIFNSTGYGVGVYTTTLRFRSNDLDNPEVTVDVTLEVVAGCIEIDGAGFDFAPTGPLTTGVTVVFTGSVEQGSLPIDYVWSFGDGTPPVTQNDVWAQTSVVTHTYTGSETGYNVTMRVSNSCSEDTASRRVGSPIIYLPLVLRNHPGTPVHIVALDSDSPVELGTAMHFTATVEGTEPITYAWDFGGAGSGSGTDGATPTYTYTAAGTYTVTLVVTNACGTDSDFITVTVSSAVGANLITPTTPLSDKTITFAGSVTQSDTITPHLRWWRRAP